MEAGRGIAARVDCNSEGHTDRMQPVGEKPDTTVNNTGRSVVGPMDWLLEHMEEVRCRRDFGDLPNIEVAGLEDNWAAGSCLHNGLDSRIQRLMDLNHSYDFHLLNFVDQCHVLDLLSHVPISCHLVLERSCCNAWTQRKWPVGEGEAEEEMKMSLHSFHLLLRWLPKLVFLTDDFRLTESGSSDAKTTAKTLVHFGLAAVVPVFLLGDRNSPRLAHDLPKT